MGNNKFIDATKIGSKEESGKKTVLTHTLSRIGWGKCVNIDIERLDKIFYLGNCDVDGDMFAGHRNGTVLIYKGVKGSEFD